MKKILIVLILSIFFPKLSFAAVSSTSESPFNNQYRVLLELDVPSIRATNQIHASLIAECSIEYMDRMMRPLLQPECLRIGLFNGFEQFFSHLENINTFWHQSSYRERREFLESLEIASHRYQYNDAFDWSELHKMVSTLYRVESIFGYFNIPNGDLVLTGLELAHMEYTLRPIISKIIADSSDKLDIVRLMTFGGSADDFTNWLAPRVFVAFLNDRTPITLPKLAYMMVDRSNQMDLFDNTQATVQNVMNLIGALNSEQYSGLDTGLFNDPTEAL